ncbi:MAG TPA: iron-sulfur cluster repair protein YtfE [Candidatus Polarisedimenticolaceae bacterium]|nr:iron-sulfur cluster repair protein YtfE [Candidatus Polarisedimenticolaceae bacterium]
MTTTETTLAELACTQPAAARVFLAHGLDFCCKGRRSLAAACSEKGLDPAAVLAELAASAGAEDLTAWSERPAPDLVRHIVTRYHEALRRDLPALIAMAEKVEARHADKPTVPVGLAGHLRAMHLAVLDHLAKEESILFPAILSGRGAMCGGPIQVMEAEHVDHGENLTRMRALAGDLVPPPEACTTWRALYLGMANLERELMEHIHLENNVLFPRVLMA